MEFTINEPEDGIVVIDFSGRLDSNGAEELNARLGEILGTNGHLIIADLAGVSQLPSPGIRFLLRLAKLIRESGGRMAIAAAQRQVEYALCIAGVDTAIPMYNSVQKAMLAF